MFFLIGMVFLISFGMAEETAPMKSRALSSEYLVVIEPDTDTIEIGDDIHLKGIIDRSLISGSPSDTVILISAPEGSLADTFVLSSPDWMGNFDYSIPADVGGLWGFTALYNGINSEVVEVEAIPSDEPGRTTLTLSGWPVYPRVGEGVTFRGRLTDASGKGISNRKVQYDFTTTQYGCITGCKGLGESEWRTAGYENTDIRGEYQFTLPVVEEGWVNVRVIFPGDQQYGGSESREIGISATNS